MNNHLWSHGTLFSTARRPILSASDFLAMTTAKMETSVRQPLIHHRRPSRRLILFVVYFGRFWKLTYDICLFPVI